MDSVNIHASCVLFADTASVFRVPAAAGVLLLGPSGSGKSDLALRLIERGAALVADDRAEIFLRDAALWARPPTRLAGLLEIRGVGIVSLPHRREAAISLVVELVESGAVARLPERQNYAPPEPLFLAPEARPPLLKIAGHESSAPTKVLAALANARFGDDRNPI